MEEGSKYIRYSKIASMGVSIPVIFLFTYLALIGATETTGISYTENCAGTLHDPCYLFWNVTMLKTVYIQANESWFNTEPPISNLILKRSWGSYWRTIDLTKPWSSQVKYALKLEKGNSYQFMFIAYKEHPTDVIEWGVNPIGVWDIALAKQTCDYKTNTWETYINHYKDEEVCYDEVIQINDTKVPYNITKEYCYNTTVLDYIETVKHSEQVCVPTTERIEYAESFLKYGDKPMGCSVKDSTIICDLAYTGDANGDGICQSGETCAVYKLTDKIELDTINNGVIDVTKEIKTIDEVERK